MEIFNESSVMINGANVMCLLLQLMRFIKQLRL